MYDCQTLMKLLYPYLDGELDIKESLRVQEHLEECPYCAEVFRQEKDFLQDFKASASIPPAPIYLREKLSRILKPSESLQEKEADVLKGPRPTSSTTLLVATMAMFIMVIAGLILYALPKQTQKGSQELAMSPVEIDRAAVEIHEGIIRGKDHFEIMSSDPAVIVG
ncbi:MAG: anti-sigma factor family protein, partial [Nitrospiria bacterium]